jgi:hypothetical protein
MHRIHTTPPADNAALRRAVYAGNIFLLPATPAARELVGAVSGLLDAEFADVAPAREAQHHLPVDEFLERIGKVRGVLARDAFFRRGACRLLAEVGFDPRGHALDAVRLRAVTHGGHDSPAARPAYSAHRDTWYANPQAQVNWWLPLHDVGEGESFALYPGCFDRPVANSSGSFAYDEWVRAVGWQSRRAGPGAVYPSALEPAEAGAPLHFAARAGQVLLFSAAHLHQTWPNRSGRTRFSIDFRTVHIRDHAEGRGAANVDNRSRGCALKDYHHPPHPPKATPGTKP